MAAKCMIAERSVAAKHTTIPPLEVVRLDLLPLDLLPLDLVPGVVLEEAPLNGYWAHDPCGVEQGELTYSI